MIRNATTNPIYDVVLVDGNCGALPDVSDLAALTNIETLPLMLVRDGGQYGITDKFVPSYGGKLSKGDLQDTTLDTATVRSQRSWAGGRGLNQATAETTQFYDSLADTRYGYRLTLPPKVYGPYALPSPSSSNMAVGAPIMRYGHSLYYAAGGKLYRSTLDSSGVTGGVLVPNWASISTDAIWASVTDFDLLEEAVTAGAYGAYIIAVTGASGKLFNIDGTFRTNTSVFPKYLNTLSYGRIGVVQYPSTSPETAATYPRGDLSAGGTGGAVQPSATGTTANNIFVLGGATYVIASNGIYALSNSTVNSPMTLVKALGIYESPTAGLVGAMWRGAYYFSAGSFTGGSDALVKWDGSTLTNVGVNRDPNNRVDSTIATTPRQLLPTDDALYLLCSDSGIKRDSIWAMTADGVWHLLWLGWGDVNNYAVGIGFDARSGVSGGLPVLQFQPRIWIATTNFGTLNTYYFYVGENISNIKVQTAFTQTVYRGYASTGYVKHATIGSEYANIKKDFVEVIVTNAEAWPNDTNVSVTLEVDQSGIETALVLKATSSNQKFFSVCPSSFTPKTVNTSTYQKITLNESAADIAAGDFIRVNGKTYQVKSTDIAVPSGLAVLWLVDILDELPTAGDYVYPSRPAGKEVRLKITMTTNNSNVTPQINRVSLRYQDAIVGVGRWGLTVRLQDDMDVNGVGIDYPYTADQAYAKLMQWAQRSEPFWAVFPDGGAAWVRMTFLSAQRTVLARPDQPVSSVSRICALELVEVAR